MLKLDIYRNADWPDRWRAEWSRLVEEAPSATMFQTWEWQSSWWKHYRGTKRPWLITLHEGNDLVGLMPMAVTSGLWRALTPIGHGKSDYLGPIARAGREEEVGAALGTYLMGAKDFDLIAVEMLRESEPLLHHVDAERVTPLFGCYQLDLPDTYSELESRVGDSLKRYLRQFDREAAVRNLRVETLSVDGLEQGLEALFSLHTKRWKERGSAGGFAFRKIRDLYRDWCRLAQAQGWIRLHQVTLDGVPIASLLGASMKGTYAYHNIGFDPAQSALRPGWVVLRESMQCAIADGCRQYDFLLGDEDYKKRWKPQRLIQNYAVTITQPTLRGRMARSWYDKGLTSLVIARRRLTGLARRLDRREGR